MKKPMPFGKYFLLDRVNVGGMAEVFKAKTEGVEGFERLVAVKRILPSIAEDDEFIKMFIDEAKIAVQLTHPNIAQIIDLGKVADAYFIAMEFIHGRDVRAIFDRAKKRGEILPVPMTCYVMMKMCEGLDYAHNKKDASGANLNLVHRDVSPQNILISFDGEVKIIDFGIAKAANKAAKTQAGILKGKFGYMSPEQVRGLPLDRRSDVFSCGIILYELLTGERLFVGESDFSTLEKVRNVEIMPPSTYNRSIPEEIERIVLKALAKEKEDRYQTAIDLHDDLQSFMYTTEKFFAQKDLAGFLRKWFPEDLRGEGEAAAGAAASPSRLPPPPPRASMPPRVSAAPPPRASMPPPRRSAPPPPKQTMLGIPAPAMPPGGMLPSQPPVQFSGAPTSPGMPAVSMPFQAAPPAQAFSAPPASAPPMQAPMAGPPIGAPTAMPVAPAPPAPVVSAPPPPAPPPIIMPTAPPPPAPPPPEPARPAPEPPAPPKEPAPSVLPPSPTLEWDDDEMATQIYEKQMLMDVAGEKDLGIDMSTLSDTAAPVPARSRAPDIVVAEPAVLPGRPRTGLIAAAIIGAAVVAAVLIFVIGRKPEEPAAVSGAGADAGAASSPVGDAAVAAISADGQAAPVAADGVATATPEGGGVPAVTKTVVVGLEEDLKPARLSLDSVSVEWKQFLRIDVRIGAGDVHTLEIDWPGRQCKEPKEGGCPRWRIDEGTEDFGIGPDLFTVAPVRVALQGILIEGASLFREVKPPGSAAATLENVAIQVEGQSSYVMLLPGTHRLIIRKEGFPDFALPEFVVPENVAEVRPLPIPLLVALEVRSDPASARVLLAEGAGSPEEIGVTGDQAVRMLLDRAGTYRIRILKGGYKAFEDAITFPEGSATIALAPTLERGREIPRLPSAPRGQMGKLVVRTFPTTHVYIDGRKMSPGLRPQHTLDLAEGRYQLTLLNNEKGIRYNTPIIIRAGQTTTIMRRFGPDGQPI